MDTIRNRASRTNNYRRVAAVLAIMATAIACGAAQAATYYISTVGKDTNTGLTSGAALGTISKGLEKAKAGDSLSIAAGTYWQDVRSVRAGEAGVPIRLVGASRTGTVIKGAGASHVMDINHSFFEILNLTIDGKVSSTQYRDKLVYVMGLDATKGVNGVRVLFSNLRNAGGECLRFKHFAYHNEVAHSSFSNCGVDDFQLNGGGKNGEAIYIGTAPEQVRTDFNPTRLPDASNYNWIHHNVMNTAGNECVDIKEASAFNLVEYNQCSGQKDPSSGGMDARGNFNTFRFNTIFDNVGAGIRFGGDTYLDGIHNEAYGNTLSNNSYSGLKLMTWPQGKICGNTITGSTAVRGDAASQLIMEPTAACPIE
jgi:hypothetical protein